MNVCEDDRGRLRLDVGSWSEFFYIEYMSFEEWADKSVKQTLASWQTEK